MNWRKLHLSLSAFGVYLLLLLTYPSPLQAQDTVQPSGNNPNKLVPVTSPEGQKDLFDWIKSPWVGVAICIILTRIASSAGKKNTSGTSNENDKKPGPKRGSY